MERKQDLCRTWGRFCRGYTSNKRKKMHGKCSGKRANMPGGFDPIIINCNYNQMPCPSSRKTNLMCLCMCVSLGCLFGRFLGVFLASKPRFWGKQQLLPMLDSCHQCDQGSPLLMNKPVLNCCFFWRQKNFFAKKPVFFRTRVLKKIN